MAEAAIDPVDVVRMIPSLYKEMRMKNGPALQSQIGHRGPLPPPKPEQEPQATLSSPSPWKLVFQGYRVGQTCPRTLYMRNDHTQSQRYEYVEQITECVTVVRKITKEEEKIDKSPLVAPGMSATFLVTFTPQLNKDYKYNLLFKGSQEKTQIKVYFRATGPRAVLDFPDTILAPKNETRGRIVNWSKAILNVGNAVAKFYLSVEGPFQVRSDTEIVEVGEEVYVTFDYTPTAGKEFEEEDLTLVYKTGERNQDEEVVIKLRGIP